MLQTTFAVVKGQVKDVKVCVLFDTGSIIPNYLLKFHKLM